MEIERINDEKMDEAVIEKAARVLEAGGVVMHPTDTCYGLAADITNVKALEKLYAIKKMAADKPVSMMVADLKEAEKFAEFTDAARKLAEKFWPGPLTLVLTRKKNIPFFFNENTASVGIRCPDSAVSYALIRAAGVPLTTTSANETGNSEVYKISDFLAQFDVGDTLPDLILDGGEIAKNIPSTIIAFGEKGPVVIREGVLGDRIRKMFI